MKYHALPLSVLLVVCSPRLVSADEGWGYEERALGAWTIQVETRLLAEQPEQAMRALSLLSEKLGEADQLLPPDKLTFLRERPIWMSLDDGKGAEYHPSRKWLSEHDRNPEMAGCVEISNAANFLAWSGHQPMMIVHELAHAFHHRRHDFGHEGLRRHFRAMKEAGIYDRIRHWDGTEKSAYALTNHKEFFAELTEAYFGRNDMFPFTRDELRSHDPAGYALIEHIWSEPIGKPPTPPAPSP